MGAAACRRRRAARLPPRPARRRSARPERPGYENPKRPRLPPALLYAHSALVADPFERLARWENPRERLAVTLGIVEPFAPLVRDSVLVLVRDRRLFDELVAVTSQETEDMLRKEEREHPPGPGGRGSEIFPREEAITRSVHVAGLCSAQFVPDEWKVVRHWDRRLDQARRELATRDIDLNIARALTTATVPLLDGVSARTLTQIRSDEEAFAAWRANLRSAVRAIHDWSSERGLGREAREAISDYLQPAAQQVRATTGRLAALRELRDQAPGQLVIGGVLAGGAGYLTGGIVPSIVGSLAGTVSAATLKVLYPPRATGAGAVIARLQEAR